MRYQLHTVSLNSEKWCNTGGGGAHSDRTSQINVPSKNPVSVYHEALEIQLDNLDSKVLGASESGCEFSGMVSFDRPCYTGYIPGTKHHSSHQSETGYQIYVHGMHGYMCVDLDQWPNGNKKAIETIDIKSMLPLLPTFSRSMILPLMKFYFLQPPPPPPDPCTSRLNEYIPVVVYLNSWSSPTIFICLGTTTQVSYSLWTDVI